MYHQFNIQQFYVLPTQCIYVFCVDLRTNSDYFPIQHQPLYLHNRDGVCLLCGTDCVNVKFKLIFTSKSQFNLSSTQYQNVTAIHIVTSLKSVSVHQFSSSIGNSVLLQSSIRCTNTTLVAFSELLQRQALIATTFRLVFSTSYVLH